MKNILISGGPVHAYLDAVKIITNKFKGGLMAQLASRFVTQGNGDTQVTYLTTKDSRLPQLPIIGGRIKVVYHDGFEDYRQKVRELAPQHDAAILGAAVANLIPANPLKGKFPSHNYKVGDRIPIEFTIAPRVISEVKAVAPNIHLFGFKLLSGVDHDELIRAAYEVLLDSHATAVIANDATQLKTKYVVTKERGVHEVNDDNLAEFLMPFLYDDYYHTSISASHDFCLQETYDTFDELITRYKHEFSPIPEGYVFGTIAVRDEHGKFLTTGRGKHELDSRVTVRWVEHSNKTMISVAKKASLNAPLLDWIFKIHPSVRAIVHYHKQEPHLTTLSYAPPGTVRDSQRAIHKSFNIEGHGCFLLLDKTLNVI